MNIFEQYGIKEVADVCLYSIELDENDDEIYIPVMYLDTLKVSTVEETSEQVSARGGLGNPELIIWDYGKEITVTLEDALYSPASQGMTWGGKHGTKNFELYGDLTTENEKVAAKLIISDFSDYSQNNNGDKVWNVTAKMISDDGLHRGIVKTQLKYSKEESNYSWSFSDEILEFKNIGTFKLNKTMNINTPSPQEIIYQIDHALNNVNYLERIEKCKANQTFVIDTDTNTLHGNYRYLKKYDETELTVFIDPKTMQPYESNTDTYTRKNGDIIKDKNLRVIKQHEIYYKWTRTKAIEYTSLGHQIIVDAIHFPGTYRLVGETYSRSRKTGKDERFQFEIPLCKMGTNNSFTLQADGDPTTFNMTLKVLRREDGVMMKLTQYSVENAKYGDYISDSTNIVPIDEVKPEYPAHVESGVE